MRVGALFLGHRLDQCDLLFEHFVVHAGGGSLFGHFAHAGHHAHDAFHAAHFHHLFELQFEVVHIELTFLEAFHHPLGLFGLDGFLGLFHQRNDIAHAQNAAGDPVRLKGFQRVHFFAKADKADGFAGDCAHRQRRTAAPVAIHTGQHHAADADFIVKFGGHIDRVLTGEPVHHQQGFARVGHIAHGGGLSDQLLINMQPAGGIEHIDVIAAKAGLGFGAFGDCHRVFALDDGQSIHTDLHTENLQLFHRGGAVHIQRGHKHPFAVPLAQPFGQFCGGGGFARALQADHQDRRGGAVDFQRAGIVFAGKHMHQLIMHNFHHLLARRDRFGDRLAGGFFLHCFDEIAGHRQRDIGLKQGNAHFAQGGFHIIFGQRTLFGQPVKHT